MTDRPVDRTMVEATVDEAAVRRRSRQADEPGWLLERRLDALTGIDDGGSWATALPSTPSPTPAPASTGATGWAGWADVVAPMAELQDLGVIIEPLDVAASRHPELVRPHLGSVATSGRAGPTEDQRVAALNAALWSTGTFIHVPAGVVIAVPIQATSRSRAASLGRFDRTLLVAEAGSTVHYIDGCSAPIYSADPLRSSVTEIVVGAGATVTHTAIQNWSTNVTNLVTKEATVEADGNLTWIDGNMGSRHTSTRPTTRLVGRGATAAVRSVTVAEAGQHQFVGASMLHAAADTSSSVEAKVIADLGGVCHHHGRVEVLAGASGVSSAFAVDGLLLDEDAQVDTSLDRRVDAADAIVEERLVVAPLDDGQLHYLASRGLPASQAEALLANGFIEPVTSWLPVEFAVEWHRLIELQRTGSVG